MASESTVAVAGRRGRATLGVTALGLLVLLIGGLFLGPFRFDEGPMWHAPLVATRDAICDIVAQRPSVLVIGDPEQAGEQSAAFERRLGDRGFGVRYTGDGDMSSWERRYVAVYWSIVGLMFHPPGY